MCGRRRSCHVGRTLVVRLLRRCCVTHTRPLSRLVRPLDRPRRIGSPVRAGRTRPLSDADGSASQDRPGPRGSSPCRKESLLPHVDSTHRCDRAPIKVQSLLMIWPGHCSMLQSPRACGHRSTINRNQALSCERVYSAAKDRPHGHDPASWIVAHHNHRRPDTATPARSPSPAEGVIAPASAMVRKPAPGITWNPGVADGRVEGPVPRSIRVPTWTDAGGNPNIAGSLYGIPVTVRIQVIPVFVLRIG